MTVLAHALPSLSVDLVESAGRSDGNLATLDPAVLGVMELRYRKFLHLITKNPGEDVAPSSDIDEMWHLHMLSPRAYVRDCFILFNDILDHNGGFGKADDEVEELHLIFAKTAELWLEEFGEPYIPDALVYQAEMKNCTKACVKSCNVRACTKACKKACKT